ncbi:MAG: hypothetical protein A4E28_02415 [Methanocella sp. PtaU1.Bin125]|nr:MAG: hypothetical protein A4E28_02415 [Methanocella sp. PtaU1.Bin125]
MGQAQGLIADILAIVDRCELCGAPAEGGKAFEIYTIESFDPADFSGLFRNIVVLCPDCKQRFDDGVISRKHLKACVRLREPALTQSLQGLLSQYDLPGAPRDGKNASKGGLLGRLVNNPASFERMIVVAGALVIVLGIFLFVVGFQNSGVYDPGIAGASGETESFLGGSLYPFMMIAGIVLALVGMFFELGLVKKPIA